MYLGNFNLIDIPIEDEMISMLNNCVSAVILDNITVLKPTKDLV